MLCWLQHIGKVQISSDSNIRRLKKTLEMNKYVFMSRHNLKIRHAKSSV